MGLLESIVENGVFEIIVLLIGIFIPKIRSVILVRRKRNLFRLKDGKERIIAFTANPGVSDNEELVDLGYLLEYEAIGILGAMIKRNYRTMAFSCYMSPMNEMAIKRGDLKQNLLLIGGPFHNSISRQIFGIDKVKNRFRFEKDASLVYDDKKWTPSAVNSSGEEFFEQDYALILNLVNPWNEEKRVICIMGCRSIGCLGGAVYLDEIFSKDKRAINYDEYALVVECNGDKEYLTSTPKLRDCISL